MSTTKTKNTRIKLTEAQRVAQKTRSIALNDAIQALIQEHQEKIIKVAADNGR